MNFLVQNQNSKKRYVLIMSLVFIKDIPLIVHNTHFNVSMINNELMGIERTYIPNNRWITHWN